MALIALLALLIGGSASAQDPEKEAQRPRVETQRQSESTQAAGEAAKLNAESAEGVSFDQVLAHPDDLDLNYKYARAQIRRGDLKGAASTLERMLLVDPNRADVRLLYAVVLYRLDNVVEAQRELDLLAGLKLPEPLASEAKQYRELVAKRRKKWHLAGRAGVGLEYDSNRNAAPTSGSRLFLDTPLPLTGASSRQDDFSKLFLGGVDLRRSFGAHEAFANVNYYRSEQNLVKSLNLQAYSVQAGAALARGRNTLTPSLVFDHVLLAQSTYLRDRGVDVRLEHRVGKGGDVYVQVRDVFEDFVPTRAIPTAGERSGIHVDVTLGGDYVINPAMRVGAGYVHGLKRGAQPYNTFQRDGFLASHVWLLGRGTFLLTTFNWNFDHYLANDPFVSTKKRLDDTRRFSTTYGLPLSLLHRSLKDLIWTTTYEYYHAGSYVQNFAYYNNKVSTLVTYKWDLGF